MMKNKNYFYILLVIVTYGLISTGELKAQSLAIETGLYKSNVIIADSKVSDLSNSFSSGGGLVFDIPFSSTSQFGIKTGLTYYQQRFSYFTPKPVVQEFRFSEENLLIPLMFTLNLKFANNEKQWLSFGIGVLASFNIKQEGYSVFDNTPFHSTKVKPGERIQAGYTGECVFNSMLTNKLGVLLGVSFHGTFKNVLKLNEGVLNVPQNSIGFKMGLFSKF